MRDDKDRNLLFTIYKILLIIFSVTLVVGGSLFLAKSCADKQHKLDESLKVPDTAETKLVTKTADLETPLKMEMIKEFPEEDKVEFYVYLGPAEPLIVTEIVEEVKAPKVSVDDGFFYYTYYTKYGKEYNMPMEKDWQKVVYDYCKKYDVPYELALAVGGIETSFDVHRGTVVGRNGSAYFGIGMVNVKYTEKRTGTKLVTPEDGIDAMCSTLGRKLEEFDNNIHYALMAYNYGSAHTRNLIRDEGKKSSVYSEKVIEIYNGLIEIKTNNK